MKKKYTIIILISTIIILFILMNIKDIRYAQYSFKYRNTPFFLDLAKKGGTDKYEILKLVPDNLSMYFDDSTKNIIFFNSSAGIWKLNNRGDMLDSINGDCQFISDLMPDGMLWSTTCEGGTNYWIINGDTINHRFIDINLAESTQNNYKKQLAIYDKLYKKSNWCAGAYMRIDSTWFSVRYSDTTGKYALSSEKVYPDKQGPKRITKPFGLVGYHYPWKGTKDSTIAYLVTDVFTSSSRTTGSDFNQGVFVEELKLPGETIRFKVRGDAMDNGAYFKELPTPKDSVVFADIRDYHQDARGNYPGGIFVIRPRRKPTTN